jgi:uncharacterized protein (TIRG00374 family)
VVAYTPKSSITVEIPSAAGQASRQAEFALIDGKTRIEPDTAAAIRPGMTVSVWESPPGLAYVWQKHVVNREPVNFGYLALAVVVCIAAVLMTFIRWFVLVRAQDLPFTVGNALRLGLVGYFFSNFLPGSVSGDVVKAAFLVREQSRRTVAVATIIIDRALALWSLIWFVALVGAGFWAAGMLTGKAEHVLQSIVISAWVIVGVTALGWVGLGLLPPYRAERFAGRLSRLPRVGHSASEFWQAVWMYRCRQRSVALAMLIAMVGFVGFVLTFYFSARVLTDSSQEIPSWQAHFLIAPIGLVIEAMPLFPGGAGIGEAGFGGLYALVGCAPALGVLASLMRRVVNWTLSLIGYLVYLRFKPVVQPAPVVRPAELTPVEA